MRKIFVMFVVAAMLFSTAAESKGFGGGFGGGRSFGGGFRGWSAPSRPYTPPTVYRPVTPPAPAPKPYVAPPAPKPAPVMTYKPVEKPKTFMEQRKVVQAPKTAPVIVPKPKPKTVVAETPKTFTRTTVNYAPTVSHTEHSSGSSWLTWGLLGYMVGSSMNSHAAPSYSQPAPVAPQPPQALPYRDDAYLYFPASSVTPASSVASASSVGATQTLGPAWNW